MISRSSGGGGGGGGSSSGGGDGGSSIQYNTIQYNTSIQYNIT